MVQIMKATKSDVMRGALNSSELVAAGLMLSQSYVWYTPPPYIRHKSLV